jgi:hypothetical protein
MRGVAVREITEAQLREMHRERMAAWGEWNDGSEWDLEYEGLVLDAVLSTLRGEREAPWMHSHAASETGCCSECDASALLQRLDA